VMDVLVSTSQSFLQFIVGWGPDGSRGREIRVRLGVHSDINPLSYLVHFCLLNNIRISLLFVQEILYHNFKEYLLALKAKM
jgi:hypothetical protein